MEKHYQVLTTKDGFEKEFWRIYHMHSVDGYTQEDAYEAAERKHTFAFGRRKYASFNSFRTVRDRRTK